MTTRSFAAGSVLLAALTIAAAPSAAQPAPAALQAGAASSTVSAPDISGIWVAGFVPRLSANPPLTPAGQALLKTHKPEDDPMARCLPPGVPRVGSTAFPIEIVQTPKQVTILYEYDHFVRRVYTDGRKHPEEPDPSWLGHSIGHWEGKTLVVDTIAINEISWLDEAGNPASDALHVIERYTPSADGQSLAHEVTIDDPKMYTTTWKATKTYRRRPGTEIMEFVCESR